MINVNRNVNSSIFVNQSLDTLSNNMEQNIVFGVVNLYHCIAGNFSGEFILTTGDEYLNFFGKMSHLETTTVTSGVGFDNSQL